MVLQRGFVVAYTSLLRTHPWGYSDFNSWLRVFPAILGSTNMELRVSFPLLPCSVSDDKFPCCWGLSRWGPFGVPASGSVQESCPPPVQSSFQSTDPNLRSPGFWRRLLGWNPASAHVFSPRSLLSFPLWSLQILSFCADSAICFKRCLFFCFYYFIQHLRVSVWRRLGYHPAVFARTKSKSEQLCNRLKWRNGICAHKVFSYSWEGKRWRKSKIVKHFSWNKMLNQESK